MQKRIAVKHPIANIFNAASRGLAVTAISGYQKFISPHKGFSCAHRVLYGCESCSQYFKQVIAEEGIITAIAKSRERFQGCREANEILKKRRSQCKATRNYYASRLVSNSVAINSENPEETDIPEDSETTKPPKLGGSQWSSKRRSQPINQSNNPNNNNCGDWVDCADCVYTITGQGCPDLSCPDLSCPDLSCGNADCLSGMDCSGLDCGSLDCGSGDCGSCG
ncbi:MAG: membrane protein insertion efficiency factor YidD [Pseudanabaena sp. ELA645]|jgi:putative component of membrane protein insertase Oxa1/YidC/SpoIIIJ protein YidD